MSSLRITAGSLRGRRVPVPPFDVRPTSERARQAYFNIIGERITGARFLDLFAGSGIFSFEAMSRGAAAATAVDHDSLNGKAIEKQAATFGVPVNTQSGDVITVLKRLARPGRPRLRRSSVRLRTVRGPRRCDRRIATFAGCDRRGGASAQHHAVRRDCRKSLQVAAERIRRGMDHVLQGRRNATGLANVRGMKR